MTLRFGWRAGSIGHVSFHFGWKTEKTGERGHSGLRARPSIELKGGKHPRGGRWLRREGWTAALRLNWRTGSNGPAPLRLNWRTGRSALLRCPGRAPSDVEAYSVKDKLFGGGLAVLPAPAVPLRRLVRPVIRHGAE